MVKPIENLQKRKMTGGRTKRIRSRRAFEKDGYAAETLLGNYENTLRRVRGGGRKSSLKFSDSANVLDRTSGKTQKVKITRVLENPANRDYERRGVISKGALLETAIGNARVTSRPAQDGVINAILTK
ncbi:MAG: 30S ribosomal protein S8e [Thaumarchaeota archaeon]|nr:30S ribosomal protein S8e [Nitrososphaerota archaeon]MDG6907930.1 30S ribosomal protein S8e [Nitrososphaerota archaeon]